MRRNKPILVTLPKETLEIIQLYKDHGDTASGLIRRAVENYYRFNKPKIKEGQYDGVDTVSHGESEIIYG